MRKLHRILAVLLAVAMIASLAACNKSTDDPNAGQNTTTTAPTKAPDNGQTTTQAPSDNTTPTDEPAQPEPPMALTISLPSDNEHVANGENDAEMQYYQKLIDELQEKTNTTLSFEWLAQATYYDEEHLGLKISTKDVADILVVGKDATFLSAAEEGLFWDLRLLSGLRTCS